MSKKLILSNLYQVPVIKKISQNIGWMFFDKIFRMVVGLIVGIALARSLGPEKFGIINFSIACYVLISSIAGLGLGEIVVRDLVTRPKYLHKILGSSILLILISSSLCYFFIFSFFHLFKPNDFIVSSFIIIISIGLFFKFTEIALFWFEAEIRSKYVTFVQTPVILLFAIIKMYFLSIGVDLLMFAWVILFETLTTSLLIILIFHIKGVKLKSLRVDKQTILRLFTAGWPLMFTALFVSIYMKTDEIMIGLLLNNESVGLYSSAARMSMIWYFVPVTIVATFFPIILKEKNKKMYLKMIQTLLDFLLWLSIIIASIISIFSETIILNVYGKEYMAASIVFTIHIWACIFVSLGLVSGRWMVAEKLEMLSLYRSILGLVSNIIFNYFFILNFGIGGAAIATALSYSISAFFADILFSKTKVMFKMKLASLNIFYAVARMQDLMKSVNLK
jgi:O-antigen/teichoic acid export membrane protein